MTDDTVTAKLAEWEALTEGATEGPWTFEPAGESHCAEPQCCSEYWDNRIWGDGAVLAESHMLSEADAEFIAAARTAMPALLGFVGDVLRLADEVDARAHGHDGSETHRPCEALARKTVADRMRRALTKRIGGA